MSSAKRNLNLNNPTLLRESQRGMDTYADVVTNPASGHRDPGLKSHSGHKQHHQQQQTSSMHPHGHHPHEGTPEREEKRRLHQTAGVCEACPGIIESTHIDPLHEIDNLNTDEGWATSKTGAHQSYMSSAAKVVSGGAKMAYGTLVGDEATAEAGKHDYYGN